MKLRSRVMLIIGACLFASALFAFFYQSNRNPAVLLFKEQWTPPDRLNGIALDTTKSDVYFLIGEPNSCNYEEDNSEICQWTHDPDGLRILFEDERVSTVLKVSTSGFGSDVPFSTVEEMREALGDETVISVSKDFLRRAYAYPEFNILFGFSRNALEAIYLQSGSWFALAEVSEYFVDGQKICPGVNCPFDLETGKVKQEYKNHSYTDFIFK